MNELISVIVPVYNSEKYLSTCIESISNQTYSNLEIIIVDDGSTDESYDICKKWAQKDARIHVIKQNNQGAAKTRNTGILAAHGEVLYFVDSDDYIEPNMIASMYTIMDRECCDCVVSSFRYINDKGEELAWYTPQLSDYQTMSGQEAAKIFLTTFDIEGFSWNKLIKKKLIQKHDIHFDENKISFEDMFGMFKGILYSDRVSFYNDKPYYYRQHEVSCVHTMDLRKIENFKDTILQIKELAQKNQLYSESEFFYLHRMILQLFSILKEKNVYADNWNEIKEKCRWDTIFNMSFYRVYQLMQPRLKDDKIKTWIKVFVVWLNFSL
ncbi:MAG: glycosyltransferase family 2 protein [Lachnospiraceae bacterium]|nr:glycosyltransferase family 2 protein [Lachnospiraceae bacterium]